MKVLCMKTSDAMTLRFCISEIQSYFTKEKKIGINSNSTTSQLQDLRKFQDIKLQNQSEKK